MREGRELRMNASEVHGRLSREICDEVAAARRRGALTWEELDRILARFDVENYDAQQEALVIELETLPLRRPVQKGLDDSFPHDLPGAGRISRRYLQELDRFPEMTRELEVAASRRLELAAQRVAAAE